MENADNNSMIKSFPFELEDIKCLKLILEIDKISGFLKQFYSAPELANSKYLGLAIKEQAVLRKTQNS